VPELKLEASFCRLCYSKFMATKLQDLTSQYLYWESRKEKAQERLDHLKEEIVMLAEKEKVKKIKSGRFYLYIITQSETRFPQIDEPGRKEVEKIVKKSGELKEVVIFDIVRLGNAYDEKKLSKSLMKKLKPFAERIKSTKIVIKEKKVTR